MTNPSSRSHTKEKLTDWRLKLNNLDLAIELHPGLPITVPDTVSIATPLVRAMNILVVPIPPHIPYELTCLQH